MGLNYLASLSHFIPELIVCLTMLALILIESSYEEGHQNRHWFYSIGFLGLLCAFVALGSSLDNKPQLIFTRALAIDTFATLSKMIMVLGTFVAIYLAKESKDIYQDLKGEFSMIALGILIGGMLLASANNMLILYIGIETLSILSYVLASLKKRDDLSVEGGIKYALYGGVSAGIMLFGMSHIFGVFGTIYFPEMAAKLGELSAPQTAIILPSFLLFFVGIGYKIAAVPFHMWSPDVYEGSPLPVTAFFSIVPKIAGISILVRVSHILFGPNSGALGVGLVGVLSIVAALTMTVGNISAIGQRSIKRMLAYSSISHVGMMLLGVLVIDEIGIQAILFYAIAYLFMTTVAFYIVSFVQDKYGNDHFERFSGMVYRYPLMSVAMALVMFSLAGIPPFAGFTAKFYLLSLIIKKQYYVLAIIAGLNSVVSLYYYLKIVRIMVFRPAEADGPIIGFGPLNQSLIVIFTCPIILLGIYFTKMMSFIDGTKIFLQ